MSKERKSIGSIKSLITELRKRPCKADCIRFFRGQAKCSWKLEPSLFRMSTDFQNRELAIINEASTLYPESFSECTSLFDKLVQCQHYGIPTRLLDVTVSPLVALYFACATHDQNSKENAKLFIFDIPKAVIYYHNDEVVNMLTNSSVCKTDTDLSGLTTIRKPALTQYYRPFGDFKEELVCVRAKMDNPRINSQSGAFLFYAKQEPTSSYNILQSCQAFEISKSHIKIILKELDSLCYSKRTLFPELSSFAEDLTTIGINL